MCVQFEYKELRSRSLHKVINGEDIECPGQSKKTLKKGLGSCLELGRVKEVRCVKRGTTDQEMKATN